MKKNIEPTILFKEGNKYHWVFEMNMWRNPTILIATFKVLALSAGIVGVFLFFLALDNGLLEALKIMGFVFGIVMGIFAVLMVFAYPLTCLLNGGKYCVLFEMDDEGVNHHHLNKQFKYAKALGLLNTTVGMMSRNYTLAGTGLLTATRQNFYSRFSYVRKVIVKEKHNVIFVNQLLTRNQVYVSGEAEFEIVLNHIRSRIPEKTKVVFK